MSTLDLAQDTLVAISEDTILTRFFGWAVSELIGHWISAAFGAGVTAVIGWLLYRREIKKLTDDVTKLKLRDEVREPSSETVRDPAVPTAASVTGNDEEKTEENLRQAQEKSRKLEEELAKERQEVEQLQTKVDLLKTKSTLFQQQEEEKTRGLEEATRKLNDKSEKLAECRKDYNSLQHQHGRAWIQSIGISKEILNLSVAVRFIDLRDRDLAKQSENIFSYIWRVEKSEHVLLSDNPSPDHRIVMFSDHEDASDLKVAINRYDLLDGERIDRRPKQSDMENDFTIIIFPEEGGWD